LGYLSLIKGYFYHLQKVLKAFKGVIRCAALFRLPVKPLIFIEKSLLAQFSQPLH
jgi:hypothetical protein